MASHDLVATLVRGYLDDAADLARFACVDRQRRKEAPASAAEVTVRNVKHVSGALRLAGACLRKLTLNTLGWTVGEQGAIAGGIDGLVAGSVRLDVVGSLFRHGFGSQVLVTWAAAMVARPAVRELRLDYFCVWTEESVALLRHPKLVVTDTLALFFMDVGGLAADIHRHAEVSTLQLEYCLNVTPALLAGTRARCLKWEDIPPLTPEQAAAIACNAGIRQILFQLGNNTDEHTLSLAALLRRPHDYSDGVCVSFAHSSNRVYEANPAVGRALAEAFASPSLRVGAHLEMDTTFAISAEAVPDDDLLAAIAACASRNKALKRLTVHIDGVPLPGNGARALLRLPEHVISVSVNTYEEERMAYAPGSKVRRDNRWLWDALMGIDLPGATTLSLSVNYGMSESSEPGVFRAAGVALARGVPNLIDLDVRFTQDDVNERWIEPFCEGLGKFVTRGDQCVTC